MRVLYHPASMMDAFIFTVTVGASETVTLPLVNTYLDGGGVSRTATFNFIAVWGDGTPSSKVTAYNDADRAHTYTKAGTYRIKLKGVCQAFDSNSFAAFKPQIRSVIKWGTVADFRYINFSGCTNLSALPTGAITGAASITTFIYFLYGCTGFTGTLDVDWFSSCPLVKSFQQTFESSGVTGSIPAALFQYNTLTQIFYNTFAYTSLSGNVPTALFTYCSTYATNFYGTFRNTNLGNASENLPDDIFDTNTNALTFAYTFYATKYTTAIPEAIFVNNTLATDFSYTFAATPWAGNIPDDLFYYNTAALYFNGTFSSTQVTGIPDHLFYQNTLARQFAATFATCYYLTYSNGGLGYNIFNNVLFSQNTLATTFSQCFWDDYNITGDIPEDMFWVNTLVTDVWGLFCKVNFTNLPEDMWLYCTLITNFSYTFYQGGWWSSYPGIAIPADLFYANTEATTFAWCFRWRNIAAVPNGLYRNNLKATGWYRCHQSNGAVINQYVFSDTDATSAYNRFAGKALDFRQCFDAGGRAGSFAPELWDTSKYNYASVNYTDCYNGATSGIFSNYADIPAGWL